VTGAITGASDGGLVGMMGGGAVGAILGGVVGGVGGAGGAVLYGTAGEAWNQYRYDNSFLWMPSTYSSGLQSNIQRNCGLSVGVN